MHGELADDRLARHRWAHRQGRRCRAPAASHASRWKGSSSKGSSAENAVNAGRRAAEVARRRAAAYRSAGLLIATRLAGRLRLVEASTRWGPPYARGVVRRAGR
jgi:hypothetical protein